MCIKGCTYLGKVVVCDDPNVSALRWTTSRKSADANQWRAQESCGIKAASGNPPEGKALHRVLPQWCWIWANAQWCPMPYALTSKLVSLNGDSSSQLKVGLELPRVYCTPTWGVSTMTGSTTGQSTEEYIEWALSHRQAVPPRLGKERMENQHICTWQAALPAPATFLCCPSHYTRLLELLPLISGFHVNPGSERTTDAFVQSLLASALSLFSARNS